MRPGVDMRRAFYFACEKENTYLCKVKPKEMKTTMKFNVSEVLPSIIKDVEAGFTIQKALERHKLNRYWFYKKMTPQQKLELQIAKTSSVTYSVRGIKGTPSSRVLKRLNKDIMSSIDNFDDEDDI